MKKERMLKAIYHQEIEPVPRGELLIDQEVINQLVPQENLTIFQQKKQALDKLNMDFVVVQPQPIGEKKLSQFHKEDIWGRKLELIGDYWVVAEPAIKKINAVADYNLPTVKDYDFQEIKKWHEESDFFVFTLLDGIFQGIGSLLNFNKFLLATVKHQKELKFLAGEYGTFLLEMATKVLKMGADGLIIGDDMASTQGPLVSPQVMEKIFYPIYKQVLKKLAIYKKPIFLHCDGNIEFLLPNLAEMGFAGIHSLEPACGMDLASVKKSFGSELCLMGNIDPALLEEKQIELVKEKVLETIRIGSPGGGFILSTASGSLTKSMDLENILAMYQL